MILEINIKNNKMKLCLTLLNKIIIHFMVKFHKKILKLNMIFIHHINIKMIIYINY